MKVKALLLSLVAVLTLGLTSCTDEMSGDQTQGKPGYLTINVKALKTRQSKTPGPGVNDYAAINNLNIFIFNNGTPTGTMLQRKYMATGYVNNITAITMQVGTLPSTAKVVVVANYGSAIDGITTYGDLIGKDIPTVGDFATNGLHMTGEANISGTTTYESHVNIAPVESKISVKWTLADDASNYVVTGVYVVNAIDQTKLPIIRQRSHTGNVWTTDNASDIAISSKINASTRTASFGLTPVAGRDYNFYTGMTDLSATNDTYLKDALATTLFTTDATGTYMTSDANALDGSTGYHYYVGENYHGTSPAGNGGLILANNATNANTIVVVRVTPKNGAPAYIKAMGHKYYTYDFKEGSSNLNTAGVVTGITEGFSVRRKTNYNLTFALTSIGASDPFVKLNTLSVFVTAEGWENTTPTF